MKKLLFLFLLCSVIINAQAQGASIISTNRPTYKIGDTIQLRGNGIKTLKLKSFASRDSFVVNTFISKLLSNTDTLYNFIVPNTVKNDVYLINAFSYTNQLSDSIRLVRFFVIPSNIDSLGVIAWGNNNGGQTSISAGLNNVVQVAGGGFHSLALKRDGTVVVWGNNLNNQTSIPAGLNNVVQVAGGGFHSLALKLDGTVVAWGANWYGITSIPAGLNNVVQISALGYHSLALKADGTVVAWGSNFYGQTSIPAGLKNVVQIAGGESHSIALNANGTLVAWGTNNYGETSIPVGLNNVIQISAGGYNSFALKFDDTIEAWGDNDYGQTSIPAGLNNVVQIAGGSSHSLTLKADGTVVAWGNNSNGQTTIPVGLNNVVQITAGGSHNLALTKLYINTTSNTGGTITPTTFVKNGDKLRITYQPNPGYFIDSIFINGVLNTDSLTGYTFNNINKYQTVRVVFTPFSAPSKPRNVIATAGNKKAILNFSPPTNFGSRSIVKYIAKVLGTNIKDSSTNTSITLTGLNSGQAYNITVQAVNNEGLISDTALVPNIVPINGTEIISTNKPTYKIGDTIQLRGSGIKTLKLKSFASRDSFVVNTFISKLLSNTDTLYNFIVPNTVKNDVYLINAFSYTNQLSDSIRLVRFFVIPRDIDSLGVIGWGDNNYGQTNIPAGLSNLVQIAESETNGYALKGDGMVVGWGSNNYGQTNFPGELNNVVQIEGGRNFSVALKADGKVFALGYNDNGQTSIPIGLEDVVQIKVGLWHSLALKSNGTVVAWGYNGSGETSIPAGLNNVVQISALAYHSLALKVDGSIVSWGSTTIPSGLSNVIQLAGGGLHSLVLKADGTVVAWGLNNYGQTNIPSGLNNVIQVAEGGYHSLALKSDGMVIAWGDNSKVQASIPTGLSNVIQIVAGWYHNLALTKLYINTTTNTGGTITPTTFVKNGDKLRITYQPNPGYFIDSIIINGVLNTDSITGYTFNNINQYQTVRVVFTPFSAPSKPRNVIGIGGNKKAILSFLPPTNFGSKSIVKYIAKVLGTNIKDSSTNTSITLTGLNSGQAYNITVQAVNNEGLISDTALVPNIVPINVTEIISTNKPTYKIGDTIQLRGNGIKTLKLKSFASRDSFVITNFITKTPISNDTNYTFIVPNTVKNDVYIINAFSYTNQLSDSIRLVRFFVIPRDIDSLGVIGWGNNGKGQTNIPAGLNNIVQIEGGQFHSLALKADGTVVAWGRNDYGETSIPAGLNNVVQIAGEVFHSLALKADGTVVAWGNNGFGQTSIPAGLNNVVQIAGGVYHSIALKTDGTVVAWGDNGFSQTNIPAGLNNVVQIAGGVYHSIALKADGNVVAWGRNNYGQTSIPAGLNKVMQIAGGEAFSLALKADGTVVAWGYNGNGQTSIPAGLNNVVQIAGGWGHSLALKADGTVVTWGYNSNGQTSIPAGLNNVVQIVAGWYHNLALTKLYINTTTNTGGTITPTTFVKNGDKLRITYQPNTGYFIDSIFINGVLNTDSITGYTFNNINKYQTLRVVFTPFSAPSKPRNVIATVGNKKAILNFLPPTNFGSKNIVKYIAKILGTNIKDSSTNTAITLTGLTIGQTYNITLQAVNNEGFISDTALVPNIVPIPVTEIISTNRPTYKIGDTIQLRGNSIKSLQLKSFANRDSFVITNFITKIPISNDTNYTFIVPNTVKNDVYIIKAFSYTNQLSDSIRLVRFFVIPRDIDSLGLIGWGYNGYGQTNIPEGLKNVVQVAGGDRHSLALKGDGTVVSWGYNGYGQTSIPAGLNNIVQVAAGYYHSLALKADGTVVSWGYNGYGQTTIPAGLNNVVQIAGGGYHSIALKADGTVVAWGNNGDGQTSIPIGLNNVVQVAAGVYHSLALKGDGTVVAWGNNYSGQTNIAAGLNKVVQIAGGEAFSLALKADGTVVAWGNNGLGQTSIPVGLNNVIQISAGGNHSLALKADGLIVAWGSNVYGATNIPIGLNNVVQVATGNSHSLALAKLQIITKIDTNQGIITPSSLVKQGENFTVKFKAKPGYRISKVYINNIVNILLTFDSIYVFKNIQSIQNIEVVLTPNINFNISNINQLDSIGKFSKYPATASYILTRNLDFKDDNSYSDTTNFKARLTSGYGFNPINGFLGIFNGNGNVIKNLFINRPQSSVGLWGSTNGGSIFNLGLINMNIVGFSNCGGIVGNSENSYIKNCYVTGKIISGDRSIGGLIGYMNNSFVENCFSLATVICTNDSYAGGLIGWANSSLIQNSFARANVTFNHQAVNGGGFIGTTGRTNDKGTIIKNCYSISKVVNQAYVSDFYQRGDFIGASEAYGSLVNKDTLFNCYSIGNNFGVVRNLYNSISNYTGLDADSLLGKTNQFKFEKGKYPYLYKLNTNEILDSQENYNEKPSGLVYENNNSILVFQGKWKKVLPTTFNKGSVPLYGVRFSIQKNTSNIFQIDSLTGQLTISNNVNIGDTIYATIKISNIFGFDTTALRVIVYPTIQISFIDQLDSIGNSANFPLFGSYLLTRSLNFDSANHYSNGIKNAAHKSGVGFAGIGNATPFTGKFDGNGFVIKNLYIKNTSTNVGFFNYIENATIVNLGVVNSNVEGGSSVGGLIGSSIGFIEVDNSYFQGKVSSTGYGIGGFIGYMGDSANITNSYAIADVIGGYVVGGFVASFSGNAIFENCYTRGTIYFNQGAFFGSSGGFVGRIYDNPTFKNCYAKVIVTNKEPISNLVAKGGSFVGAFLSSNTNSTILINCYGIDNKNLIGTDESNKNIVLMNTISPYLLQTPSSALGNSSQYLFRNNALPILYKKNTNILLDSQNNNITASNLTYLGKDTIIGFEGIENKLNPSINLGTSVALRYTMQVSNQNIKIDSNTGDIFWNKSISSGFYTAQITLQTNLGNYSKLIFIKIVAPIIINYIDQFALIGTTYPMNGYYILGRNLDFDSISHYQNASNINSYKNGTGFIPIGTNSNPFTGVINGNNFYLKNLRIINGNSYQGFISYANGASIWNFKLLNVYIKGNSYVGGFVGTVSSSGLQLENSYVTGIIEGQNSIGGLVGFDRYSTQIKNCFAIANVSGTTNVGGLVGYGDRRINVINCYHKGILKINNSSNTQIYVGAIFGYAYLASLKNCYANTIIVNNNTISTNNYIGSLVGYLYYGTINNSYATNPLPLYGYLYNAEIINSVSNYQLSLQPSVIGNSNQFKFEKGKFPILYKYNTEELLDSQINQSIPKFKLNFYLNNYLQNNILLDSNSNYRISYSIPNGYYIDSFYTNLGENLNKDSVFAYTFTNINANRDIFLILKQKQINVQIIGVNGNQFSININDRTLAKKDSTKLPYFYGNKLNAYLQTDSNFYIDSIWIDNSVLYSYKKQASSNETNPINSYNLNINNLFNNTIVKIKLGQFTPPAPPRLDTVIVANAQAYLYFTPPTNNGGVSILKYEVSSINQNIKLYATQSPVRITGLQNDSNYQFVIKAINKVGTSIASNVSNVIIPKNNVYVVTTNVTNGLISGGASITNNGTYRVTYQANSGFQLDKVYVNDTLRNDSTQGYSFKNFNRNQYIYVVFKPIIYKLLAQSNNGGMFILNRESKQQINISTNAGSNNAIIIQANYGYKIDSIFVNNVLKPFTNKQLTQINILNILGDSTIRVVFKKASYVVKINYGKGGQVYPSNQINVLENDSINIRLFPNYGYEVDSIFINNQYINTSVKTNYWFKNVQGDSTIRVVFKNVLYSITSSVKNTNGGIISPAGKQFAQKGENKTYYIIPYYGYKIDTIWINEIAVIINPNATSYFAYTFKNIQGDSSIKVSYKKNRSTIVSAVNRINNIRYGRITPSGKVTLINGQGYKYKIIPNSNGKLDSILIDNKKVLLTLNADSSGYDTATQIYTFKNIQSDKSINVFFSSKPAVNNYKINANEYTIISSSNLENALNVEGENIFSAGDNFTYTFEYDTLYYLDSLIIDGVVTNNYLNINNSISYAFTNINANHSIRAVFKKNIFTIISEQDGNGNINYVGTNYVKLGAQIKYSYQAESNYFVDSVIVNGVLIDSPQSFTFTNVQQDNTIKIIYNQSQYTIQSSVTEGGNINPLGTLLLNKGETYTYQYSANAGYSIDSVIIDGIVNYDSLSSYTFTNVQTNHRIQIVYKKNYYTITSSKNIEGGLISNEGINIVVNGSTQLYFIQANAGYKIDSIYINNIGQSINQQTYIYEINNINKDINIYVIFKNIYYTITASTEVGGGISPIGNIQVKYDSSQAFSITPNTGYEIDSVIVNGVNVGKINSYTFNNVKGDSNIRVTFKLKTFSITATAGNGGSISPQATTTLNYGTSQRYIITANTGYVIDSVIVNGFKVDSTTSYTFNNITANQTIQAVFKIAVVCPQTKLSPNIVRVGDALKSDITTFAKQRWYLAGTIKDSTTNNTYTPTDAGVYTLLGIDALGCESNLSKKYYYSKTCITPAGRLGNGANIQANIVGNANLIIIKWCTEIIQDYITIKILSIDGVSIYEQKVPANLGVYIINKQQINNKNYVIEVIDNKGEVLQISDLVN